MIGRRIRDAQTHRQIVSIAPLRIAFLGVHVHGETLLGKTLLGSTLLDSTLLDSTLLGDDRSRAIAIRDWQALRRVGKTGAHGQFV